MIEQTGYNRRSETALVTSFRPSPLVAIGGRKRMAAAKPIPTLSESQIAKFWSLVDKSGECWAWTGTPYHRGYGRFSIQSPRSRRSRQFLAHRVAWTLTNGPIQDGLTLDHLCRNHGCVNPAHIEAVSHKENVLRGASPTAANAAKTHCAQGHAYTVENSKINRWGRRMCRQCYLEKLDKRAGERRARGARVRASQRRDW